IEVTPISSSPSILHSEYVTPITPPPIINQHSLNTYDSTILDKKKKQTQCTVTKEVATDISPKEQNISNDNISMEVEGYEYSEVIKAKHANIPSEYPVTNENNHLTTDICNQVTYSYYPNNGYINEYPLYQEVPYGCYTQNLNYVYPTQQYTIPY